MLELLSNPIKILFVLAIVKALLSLKSRNSFIFKIPRYFCL